MRKIFGKVCDNVDLDLMSLMVKKELSNRDDNPHGKIKSKQYRFSGPLTFGVLVEILENIRRKKGYESIDNLLDDVLEDS